MENDPYALPIRRYYHRLALVPADRHMRSVGKKLPGSAEAEVFLAYGVANHDRDGIGLELIAAGRTVDGELRFGETNNRCLTYIPLFWNSPEYEVLPEGEKTKDLEQTYARKLAILRRHYSANEGLEQIFWMEELDPFRDFGRMDDVIVRLTGEGWKPARAVVKITGYAEGCFVGILKEHQSPQSFDTPGPGVGDVLAFFLVPDGKKSVLESTVREWPKYTDAQLRDGALLEEAISNRFKDGDPDNYLHFLSVLADSTLILPMKETKKGAEPHLITWKGKKWLPAYTSDRTASALDREVPRNRKGIRNVIFQARERKGKISGILLNPETDPLPIPEDLWNLLQTMKLDRRSEPGFAGTGPLVLSIFGISL